MGNFYTNIVLPESDLDRVSAAVEPLGRRAYVAGDGKTTVVYDEACDKQDIQALERLARELSRKLDRPALAVCNHDDDVLWYALVEDGKTLDVYESDPGYFDGSGSAPKGGDADRLCRAFGAIGRNAEVEALLRKGRSEIVFEVDRHQRLLELLGLPVEPGVMGYGYVNQGELTRRDGLEIRALGGADEPEVSGRGPGSEAAPPPAIDPQLLAQMQEEAAYIAAHTTALALGRVKVPPRFVELLGGDSVNGYVAFMRLSQYVVRQKLQVRPGVVRADDLVADLLGEREFPMLAMMRLLGRAFDVKPLTPEETAELQVPGSEMQRRYREAMLNVATELSHGIR
jgi:hypothetical protein